MRINKNKNFLYWIYLGIISTGNGILEVIRLISIGFFKIFDSFFTQTTNTISYSIKGVKYIIIYISTTIYTIIISFFHGVKYIFLFPFKRKRKKVIKEKKIKKEPEKVVQKQYGVLYEKKDNDTTKRIKKDLIFDEKTNSDIKSEKKDKKEKKIIDFFGLNRKKLEKEGEMLLIDLNSEEAKRTENKIIYKYKVKDTNGNFISGYFGGYSKFDVQTYLLNKGYEIYKIETSNWINKTHDVSGLFSKKLSYKELIFWLTQLSTYIRSGIPLTESVSILSSQMGKRNGRQRVFESIIYELTMGESFSSALEKQGSIFPNLLINMLRAAEAAGNLEETLDDMALYYTDIEKTRKQMITAMTYPSIIMIFAIAVISFIMLYVVPQFVNVYDQIGSEVSGLTLTIINISNFLSKNLFIIIIFITVTALLIITLYKNIKLFRSSIQIVLMKLPIIGKIIIYNELTIFTKTFSSLLKNNVFITESIDILSKITNNEIYKSIMFNTIANIAKGNKISESFKNHWAIPDVAYYMIVTGESTGELAEMMNTVSSYYQEMHRNVVNNLKAFIEPILIVFLAIIVGIVVLAIVIPMFDIYEKVSL